MSGPRASVVVATYNRPELLLRLLGQIGAQSLPAEDYEVIVVDDGSAEPVEPRLRPTAFPFALRVETQPNAGAAAARHRGALAARGEVLVIVDDDMQVGPDFLERHLALHPPGTRRVVLGRIVADPAARMPLFERWHARMLDDLAEGVSGGRLKPRGNHLYTGNVSLRREDYLAVGGFDPSLGHSEDAELGLRLEKAGATFVFSEEARSLHGSDHASLSAWRRRAFLYGVFDHRIGRKHPELAHASPWRFLFELNPVSRPLMAATLLAPGAARPLAALAYRAAALCDRLGLESPAMAGTTLAYGLDYFRGLRSDAGRLTAAARELGAFLTTDGGPLPERLRAPLSALERMLSAVRADHEALLRNGSKYGHPEPGGALGADLVQKIGFQLLAACRLMQALREAELPLGAKLVSRLVRHLYGSDVHWDARIEPGVTVVHGMGLAISHAASIGAGCILFQNVTLGMGIDPVTRQTGAPRLEPDVHVGPGATLLGPIVVGRGSKVMAGVVLTESVPPGSLVEAPRPEVRPRVHARQETAERAVAPIESKSG